MVADARDLLCVEKGHEEAQDAIMDQLKLGDLLLLRLSGTRAYHSESSVNNGDDSDDKSDVSYDVEPTVTLYKVTNILKDANDECMDIELSLMQYSLKPAQRQANYFHIYGATVVHDTTVDLSSLPTQAFGDIICPGDENFSFVQPVDGDKILYWMFDNECPAGCDNGWLETQQKLHELVTEPMQTISDYEPVCPVCIGKPLSQEYQGLRELRESGYALDLGVLVEFYGRLNPRRRELGYSFHQFDEREWGYSFDDMLSEEDEESGGSNDGWDYYDEAFDTSGGVLPKPASEEAVAALPRSTFADVKATMDGMGEATCQICQEEFGKETVVAHLPCKHFFCNDCIPIWLKQSASCPTCRYRLPLRKDEGTEGSKAGEDDAEMASDDEEL